MSDTLSRFFPSNDNRLSTIARTRGATRGMSSVKASASCRFRSWSTRVTVPCWRSPERAEESGLVDIGMTRSIKRPSPHTLRIERVSGPVYLVDVKNTQDGQEIAKNSCDGEP